MTAPMEHQDTRFVDSSMSDTLPTKSVRSARIWDRIADRYAAQPVADEGTYFRKLNTTREYLHKDAIVLEYGCGTGSTALAHAPYVKHIRASDFSGRMIEIAREKAAEAGIANVDFVCDAVDGVREPDESIDTILALNLLHVLKDWSGTIGAAHRMLKPGGVFVSSTVCLNDGLAFLRPVAFLGRRMGLMPQLSFFSRVELERTLVEAGFDIPHNWQPAPKRAVFIVARKLS